MNTLPFLLAQFADERKSGLGWIILAGFIGLILLGFFILIFNFIFNLC